MDIRSFRYFAAQSRCHPYWWRNPGAFRFRKLIVWWPYGWVNPLYWLKYRRC